MKRKLSLLLALLMVLTIIPVQPSFAASKNEVDRVVTVKSDANLEELGENAPLLTIQNDKNFKSEEEALIVLGSGAKWVKDIDKKITTDATFEIVQVSDKTLHLTIKGFDQQANEKAVVKIPMYVKLDSVDGELKVKVESSGAITNGEYTYARVSGNDILMSVETKGKISRAGNDNKVGLKFTEAVPNAFSQGVKLRLPKNFTFELDSTPNNTASVSIVKDSDDREIEITFTNNNNAKNDVAFANFKINPDRKAAFGDVDVTVKEGKVSPNSLVVAEHVDYNVEVKVDKVIEVLAGRDINKENEVKVTLEQKADNAIIDNRYIEFSFVDKDGELVDASIQKGQKVATNGQGNGSIKLIETDDKEDGYLCREFELKTDKVAKKSTYEIPFVVAADYEGELYLKVVGAGVEEQLVKIADVKAPVTFEVAKQLSQVKIGLQDQDAADITVTEVQAGALQDYTESKNEATYSFTPAESGYFKFKDAKIKVEKGNISYNDKKSGVNNAKTAIEFIVDRKSTEASTIKFSDIKVTLDRTVPYGGVKLKANFGVVGGRHDLTNTTKKLDYFVTVTPVDDVKRLITVFTIGEKSYSEKSGNTVNAQAMDVAPYAKSGSTMLPIRFVGNAIGARTEWNQATSEVTITKDNTIVSINIYSDTMYVNGSPVKMAQKPDVLENRVFLPLKSVAQAFGLQTDVNIFWHEGKGTVTILPQDASQAEIDSAKAGTILD